MGTLVPLRSSWVASSADDVSAADAASAAVSAADSTCDAAAS